MCGKGCAAGVCGQVAARGAFGSAGVSPALRAKGPRSLRHRRSGAPDAEPSLREIALRPLSANNLPHTAFAVGLDKRHAALGAHVDRRALSRWCPSTPRRRSCGRVQERRAGVTAEGAARGVAGTRLPPGRGGQGHSLRRLRHGTQRGVGERRMRPRRAGVRGRFAAALVGRDGPESPPRGARTVRHCRPGPAPRRTPACRYASTGDLQRHTFPRCCGVYATACREVKGWALVRRRERR